MTAEVLVALALGWAALPVALLGLWLLTGRSARESWLSQAALVHSVVLLVIAALLGASFVRQEASAVLITVPPLFELHGARWEAAFLVDRLSVVGFALLAAVYAPIVRFSIPSFHREPGAERYWFLVFVFALGLALVFLSGNLDVFFLGWEVVGVTSVMLISFFRHNLRSTYNSLRALVFYRLCDLGVLGALVWMHHAFPSSGFMELREDAALPTSGLVALALLFGSLAKAAQLPMSPWLHRAMEGPASSSAIFYGALSIHLGPFLLLRTAPLWLPHEETRVLMGVIGLTTAVYATLVGRTRPDAKTALAYATMRMLGIIFVELALGLHRLALVHLVVHAGARTWQFLRSSSLIDDFQDNPSVSAQVRARRQPGQAVQAPAWQQRLYVAAMRQFWLDEAQQRFIARPVAAFFKGLEAVEARFLGAEDDR
ncbi:MAG: proton-conducting transporter membrane subunit [Myxococcaceae bacterium]